MEKPLVDKMYLLEKFPGKGGWTYAAIPEILQNKNNPFGWVVVRGSIDDYPLDHYKLMPMGNGKLFLPVKSEIRKKIKKQAGDTVHVILYSEDRTYEAPQEIVACLKDESQELYHQFISLSASRQKQYIDWIYQTKDQDVQANRIVKMLEELGNDSIIN